jgi:amidase
MQSQASISGNMRNASLMSILGALGPIATSARDLALFCRVMLEYKPWLVEPPLLEMPWRQDIVDGANIPEKLSVAILWDDRVVLPHPPILDALKQVKDALVAAGHEVISWEPVDHQGAWDLIVSASRKSHYSCC